MSDVIAGRIELLTPLARGASGSLWRAIDRRYGAICAAKVMRQRDGADVLRFVREQTVGSAQGLGKHPHLLPPYTWVAEDDTIVLVMPLAHGGTLAGALAEHGALSPSLVAQLLRQLLDALAAMHEASWVHRDVKPANLLLHPTRDGSPHLLLADFGIALHETDVRLTETGFTHGTPGFMAPEILEGLGTSAAQDVWAAAACALEALAPPRPRERLLPAELPGRLEHALATSHDLAARPLEHLLQEMLASDPAARPSAARARDRIPLPTSPASSWSRTSHGALFVVTDQIDATDSLHEVPLDGPGTLPGLSPGLHERLSALSRSASSPPAVPSPGAPQRPPAQAAPSLAQAVRSPVHAVPAAQTAQPTQLTPPAPLAQSVPSAQSVPPAQPQGSSGPPGGSGGSGSLSSATSATGSPGSSSAPGNTTERFVNSPTRRSPAAQHEDQQPVPAPGRGGAGWAGVLLLVISVLCLVGAGFLLISALG